MPLGTQIPTRLLHAQLQKEPERANRELRANSSQASSMGSTPMASAWCLSAPPAVAAAPCVSGAAALAARVAVPVGRRRRWDALVVCAAPDEEKITRRSPLDFPIEWERPKPGRRPDIFPKFSPMKTPLPHPLPADDPLDDDEEEEEEEQQPQEEPQEDDPDKEEPEEDDPDKPTE